MVTRQYINIPCVEVTQPIGTFFVGVIDAEDIVRISYSDVHRPEGREIEKYLGIERDLSEGRVAEIMKYVRLVDAAFPSSVILAIKEYGSLEDDLPLVELTSDRRTLRIRNREDIAKIIDGQHRIAGLAGYDGRQFQVNVTIFLDMQLEDQAMVFSTTNLKQAKVNKSLSYNLYEFVEKRSPQKTCHNLAKFFNSEPDSPFKGKIKILGKASGVPSETITQATFVDRMLKYLTRDAMSDRDLIKRGKKPKEATGKDLGRLIFRNMFIHDQDELMARIVWNFFAAVEERWQTAWGTVERGNILNRTTGFAALMRFMRSAYCSLDDGKFRLVAKRDFTDVLQVIDLSDADFQSETYKPGSSGEGQLFRELLLKSGIAD